MTILDLQPRCGTFPYLNIAEGFGLPYGVVIRWAQAIEDGEPCTEADFDIVWNALRNADKVAYFDICIRKALGKWHAKAF